MAEILKGFVTLVVIEGGYIIHHVHNLSIFPLSARLNIATKIDLCKKKVFIFSEREKKMSWTNWNVIKAENEKSQLIPTFAKVAKIFFTRIKLA